MATEQDLNFAVGETAAIDFTARDRAGDPLANAAAAVIELTIGAGEAAKPIVAFKTAGGQFALTNEAAATWRITLSPADLAPLGDRQGLHYNIWSTVGTEKTLQAKGRFVRCPSIRSA